MIMAGGTGGHVFPALAVAKALRQRGWDVFWLGTRNSFEARVVPQHDFEIEWIDIKGVRGKHLLQKLMLPLRLLHAMYQAMRVIQKRKPTIVLGMGGFVSGPGGLVSRLMGRPLVIQEQNTIPGMTNRYLAKIANAVFEAFPGSFDKKVNARLSGNPVRHEMFSLESPEKRISARNDAIHLLVLGGSLGAQALNETIPLSIALLPNEVRPAVKHQAGRDKLKQTLSAYQEAAVEAEVVEFVDDMSAAYSWADLVVCRSGALTVSELTAVGIGSILVPYPHAVDDHQTHNGQFLVDADAAVMLQQRDLTPDSLAKILNDLIGDRSRLINMARSANALAQAQATDMIADSCEELVA